MEPNPPYTGYDEAPIKTNLQRMLLGLPWVFIFFATAATVSRFWARHLKRVSYGWDDWLCLFAVLLLWGLQISNTISVVYGGSSLPFMSLSMAQWSVFFKAVGANLLLWVCGIAVLQFSILTLYLRIFNVKKSFRIACFVGIGLVAAWWIASFFVILFECDPVSHVWEPWKPGTCINVKHMCSGTGVSHIVLDFLILLGPIPMVLKLQMSRTRKTFIASLFLIGLLATICSILRVDCLVELVAYDPNNPSGTLWLPTFLEILEISIGILCICVPTLAPVWTATKDSKAGSILKSLLGRSKQTTKDSEQLSDSSSAERQKSARSESNAPTVVGAHVEIPKENEKPWNPIDASAGQHRSQRDHYEVGSVDNV